MSGFKRAVKHESKLRMALAGPAGAGKTFTALTLAAALANGGSVAVIDTERGSASKYADQFAFDVLELDNFDPRKYVEAIHDAEAGGYTVLVIDSLSHAWNGTGGLLEIVEGIAKRAKGGNTFAAWADATPIQNLLINAITSARLHIIATMRSKQEHVQERDEKTGRTTVRKVGMAPVQRDGMEYEFDVFADLDQDNTLIVQKSRCPALTGAVIARPGADVARTLAAWLLGEAPADPPAPATVTQPMRKPAPPTATDNVTAAQWDALKTRMRSECKLTTVALAATFMRTHIGRDLGGELPTLAEYDKLIAAVNRAAAALRKVERTARPIEPAAPSADEMAAAQADYDASVGAEDFPHDDEINDVPGARDMRELPVPAVRP